jgi:hypothetical protein
MNIRILFTLVLGFGLVGCAALESTPSVIAIETAIAQTQQAMPPTPTVIPTTVIDTQFITKATDLPLPSPTLSLIATEIAKPKPIFEYAYIYGMGHLNSDHLLVTIEVPSEISGSYHAIVGNEIFDCEVLPEYPNRLYCTGLTYDAGKFVQLTLIDSLNQTIVFQTELGIPPNPYAEQFVETKKDKPVEKTPNQPTPLPTLPPYPYP